MHYLLLFSFFYSKPSDYLWLWLLTDIVKVSQFFFCMTQTKKDKCSLLMMDDWLVTSHNETKEHWPFPSHDMILWHMNVCFFSHDKNTYLFLLYQGRAPIIWLSWTHLQYVHLPPPPILSICIITVFFFKSFCKTSPSLFSNYFIEELGRK